MNISSYLTKGVSLDWWKEELEKRPDDHKGPALVLAVTTVVINALWGKSSALSFVCLSVVTYPFAHYQIDYLLFLDAHETAYAIAVVGIQIFATQFPLFSPWALPLSIALASAITVRGMKIRHLLQKQKENVTELSGLNTTLTGQVSSLTENVKALQAALTALKEKISKKKTAEKTHTEVSNQHEEVVIQVETDYVQINQMLTELTSLCQVAAEETGITNQLASVDEHNQKLAQLNSTLQIKNRDLEEASEKLKQANEKFEELISRSLEGEDEIKKGLESFRQWALSLKTFQSFI